MTACGTAAGGSTKKTPAYGAEIGVLKLFWRIIPVPLLYGLPAPLILAAYMDAVCALSRLTQGEEEVSFS